MTYEEIMDAIKEERHMEFLCVVRCRQLMKKTLNPFYKIRCYFDAKRFMDHVIGIDLVIQKLLKTKEES